VFAEIFNGAQKVFDEIVANVPDEWLRALAARTLTEEEKKKVEALGGWEKLLETLRQRLAEQKERHEGGNKWIGTQGTSPFEQMVTTRRNPDRPVRFPQPSRRKSVGPARIPQL